MNSNQLKWGALLSYVQMALSVLIGLLYTPVMIQLLGQNEYGLYNTVASTVAMLSVLNLGFGGAYIRYFAQYKKRNNGLAIAKLNGLFLLIFSVIGLVALFCGLYLTFHLELVFDQGLTDAEYRLARILMVLLTGSMAISFPLSVFANIIAANEHYIVFRVVGLIRSVISPLLTLPLLLMGFRSVAMVVVTVSLSLVADVINVYYVLHKLREKFAFGSPEKGIVCDLIVYTGFIAINLIVDQVNWNIDKMLLARYKGTAVVAIYSVGYSLYSYYQSFSTAVSGVFSPRIHRIVNETQQDPPQQRVELTELFTRVGRIQFLILGLIASGVVFFGKPFIVSLWAGASYGESYYVAMLLILPASIALIQNLGIEIQRAENRHQFRSIVYAIMALINLLLSIFLCQRYGAVGSALGTAISLVVANGLIMNIYYHKRCNIDILFFWKSILRLTLGLPVPVAVGILLNRAWDLSQPLSFMAGVLIYSAVYCVSMWFIGMNTYEKNLIASPIKKLCGRIGHGKHHE